MLDGNIELPLPRKRGLSLLAIGPADIRTATDLPGTGRCITVSNGSMADQLISTISFFCAGTTISICTRIILMSTITPADSYSSAAMKQLESHSRMKTACSVRHDFACCSEPDTDHVYDLLLAWGHAT